MGRVAVQNISPYKHAKSWEEIGKLVPHIAAGSGQKPARLDAIAEPSSFVVRLEPPSNAGATGIAAPSFPRGRTRCASCTT